ncbi:MAG: hypothetical protein U5L96_14375 [Owenweeksia sp.]|nr:hypothetical protein [Owenweeksia sp.]
MPVEMCFGNGSGCHSGQAGCGEFIETNGMVVVEVESEPTANGNWYLGNGSVNGLNIPSPSGSYYMWQAFCGSAPNYSGCTGTNSGSNANAMTYKIYINNPGRYRFKMRSWQPGIKYGSHGAGTENNDFWLQIPSGGGVKEKGGTEITIGTNEWVKIYQNKTSQWTWDTETVDNNPHAIYIDFPAAGSYTLKIGARSKLLAIDRFALYRSDNASNNVTESSATTAMPAESGQGSCSQVANGNAVHGQRGNIQSADDSQSVNSTEGHRVRLMRLLKRQYRCIPIPITAALIFA